MTIYSPGSKQISKWIYTEPTGVGKNIVIKKYLKERYPDII
jgi:hypothetical protein